MDEKAIHTISKTYLHTICNCSKFTLAENLTSLVVTIMLLSPHDDYTRIYINCKGFFPLLLLLFVSFSLQLSVAANCSGRKSRVICTEQTHIERETVERKWEEISYSNRCQDIIISSNQFIAQCICCTMYTVHSQILIGSSKAPLWTFPTKSGCIISLNKLYHRNGAKMVGWSSNEWQTSFIGFWLFRAKVRTLFWCRNSHSICIYIL